MHIFLSNKEICEEPPAGKVPPQEFRQSRAVTWGILRHSPPRLPAHTYILLLTPRNTVTVVIFTNVRAKFLLTLWIHFLTCYTVFLTLFNYVSTTQVILYSGMKCRDCSEWLSNNLERFNRGQLGGTIIALPWTERKLLSDFRYWDRLLPDTCRLLKYIKQLSRAYSSEIQALHVMKISSGQNSTVF